MYPLVMALVRPSLHDSVHPSTIPTEPEAIAVYALLAWSIWLVWMGNRSSKVAAENADDSSEEQSDGKSESKPTHSTTDIDAPGAVRPRQGHGTERRGKKAKKKLTRAQRRRRGHIDWIQ